MARSVESRFWAKVDKAGPRFGNRGRCWLWTAGKSGDGYGRFTFRGQRVVAHRFAYGPVPRGLELDHLCRRILCVRRSHLEAVTHLVNIQRGANGQRGQHNIRKTHCPAGHLYSGGNLYIAPNGGRRCRRCHREESRHYRTRTAA